MVTPEKTSFLAQRLCRLILALVVLLLLAIENSSCGRSPVMVKVVGELVGATVEAGILRLVKNEFRAKVMSSAGGNITKYLIEQIGIERRNSSDPPIQLSNVVITDGKWQQVMADNLPAFLLISERKEVIEKAKAEVPPTCWLSQKAIGNGKFILTWTTHNAINAKLNDEEVSLQGNREVSPSQSTTYWLKVQGPDGKRYEDSAMVEPPPTPIPLVSLTVEKIIVDEDGSLWAGDWDFKVYLNEDSGPPLDYTAATSFPRRQPS